MRSSPALKGFNVIRGKIFGAALFRVALSATLFWPIGRFVSVTPASAQLSFPNFNKPREIAYKKLYYRFEDNRVAGETVPELVLTRGDLPAGTWQITITVPRGVRLQSNAVRICEYRGNVDLGSLGHKCSRYLSVDSVSTDGALVISFSKPLDDSVSIGIQLQGLLPRGGLVQFNALAKSPKSHLISSYVGSWLIPGKASSGPGDRVPVADAAGQLSLSTAVKLVWSHLVELTKNDLKQAPPKLAIVLAGDTRPDDCLSRFGDYAVSGSYYCSRNRLVALEFYQLESIRRKYGDGGVAFAIAHEYAHFLQDMYGRRLPSPYHELQADCLASALLLSNDTNSVKKLGISVSDVYEMIDAVYSLGGGEDHGESPQRVAALNLGMREGIGGCVKLSAK